MKIIMTQPKTVPSINATANGLYSDKKTKHSSIIQTCSVKKIYKIWFEFKRLKV